MCIVFGNLVNGEPSYVSEIHRQPLCIAVASVEGAHSPMWMDVSVQDKKGIVEMLLLLE